MKCKSSNEISASKAIEYIQLRLSAEQAPPIDIPIKTFKDVDKMIELMRSRLKSSCQLRYRDDFHHSSNLPKAQNHYALGVRSYQHYSHQS